jgi:paraquat-inducible protein B
MTSYLAHEASQTTEIPQTTTENPIESNSTEKVVKGIEEQIDLKLGELSKNFTQKAVEAFNEGLSNLKTSVENLPKVIEKAIETNNQNMQECCTSNKKSVEKLQEAMENQLKEMKEMKEDLATGLQHSKNVEKELKDFLKQELSSIIQEKLDAMEKRLTSGA